MSRDNAIAVSVTAIVFLIALIVMAWWYLIEAPSRRRDRPYQPRHVAVCTSPPPVSIQPGESASWREEWTDRELAQLAGRVPLTAVAVPAFSYAAERAKQHRWLLDRRAEANAVTDDLVRGFLADPWWTRRR
jgi:hypothetical protein